MKAKGILIAVLLTATNFAWAAGGGLGIDNVKQHMNTDNVVKTDSGQPDIDVQVATGKFDVVTPDRDRALTDTDFQNDPYYDLDLLS